MAEKKVKNQEKDLEKKKEDALKSAIKEIEKQFGKGSVMKLGERTLHAQHQ